jgi:thiol-disulfide isomerase/thioredoxin
MTRGFCFLMLLGIVGSMVAGRHLNKPFADFEATDAITGAPLKLSDFRGKVVLVDFWATWCGPCVRELPNVKQAWARYKDDGLVIISISLDDKRTKFESFVKSRGMDWHHVMDGGRWNSPLVKKYGIDSIPAMFIVNHEGICVADAARGARLSTEIERALKAAGLASESSQPDPASNAEALVLELTAARDQLIQATLPIQSFGDRLDAAGQELSRLEAQLPAPSSPAATPSATQEALAQLRADLLAIRGEMFAMGILRGASIDLPPDPFVNDSLDQQRALLAAHEQVAAWRGAIDGMKQSAARVRSSIDPVRQQLDEAVAAAQNGRQPAADPYALTSQTQAIASRWGESWKIQLANVATRGIASPGHSASSAKLKDVATRLGNLGGAPGSATSPAAPESSGGAASTAEAFESICTDLADVAADLKQGGANVEAVRLPKTPERGVDPRRARAELDLNLRIAREAIDKLTAIAASVGSGATGIQAHLDQIKQLNEQVNRGEMNAEATTAARRQFEVLCAQLLESMDA